MMSEHSSPLDFTAVWLSAPGSGVIHVVVVNFDALAQGKRYSNLKETSCLPLLKAGFEPWKFQGT